MIGQLKYRATLQKMNKQDNGRGGWIEVPIDLGPIWVAQYRLSTRQEVAFRQLELKAEHKFIARYNADIDNRTTMVVNGRKYRVETVELPVDRTDFMEIYAVGEK